MAAASAEAAASAATSAAAAAAAAALFKVASNLWMAEASAVGPLLLPEGNNFTTCYGQTLRTTAVQLQTEVGSFVLCMWKQKKTVTDTAGLTHSTQRTDSSIVLS